MQSYLHLSERLFLVKQMKYITIISVTGTKKLRIVEKKMNPYFDKNEIYLRYVLVYIVPFQDNIIIYIIYII